MPGTRTQVEDPEAARTPERRVADSLLTATLLAFTGGILDAFLYLDHGQVFAGAMTGNAVLCGIALVRERWHEIVHHALPILAFVCGVWLAEILQVRVRRHAVTVGLGLEMTGLLAASFLPASFPDPVYVFAIALLTAFQIASFRKTESYTYSSTFITGDLRSLVIGAHAALDPAHRAEGLRQARDLGTVVASFGVGAVAGASVARRMGNHTLWLPVAVLMVVFLMAMKRSLEESLPEDGDA